MKTLYRLEATRVAAAPARHAASGNGDVAGSVGSGFHCERRQCVVSTELAWVCELRFLGQRYRLLRAK
jgi:hypothetical protein